MEYYSPTVTFQLKSLACVGGGVLKENRTLDSRTGFIEHSSTRSSLSYSLVIKHLITEPIFEIYDGGNLICTFRTRDQECLDGISKVVFHISMTCTTVNI